MDEYTSGGCEVYRHVELGNYEPFLDLSCLCAPGPNQLKPDQLEAVVDEIIRQLNERATGGISHKNIPNLAIVSV